MPAKTVFPSQKKSKDRKSKEWQRRSTYSIWYMMIVRCYDERHDAYLDYGARGIAVQEDWLYSPYSQASRTLAEAFANFLRDVGLRPNVQYTLDRIDPNGDYTTPNLRWATKQVQARNKRASLYIPDPQAPGVMIPVAELAERLGITYQKLRYQLKARGVWPGDVNS
jgi:hypothetical protein